MMELQRNQVHLEAARLQREKRRRDLVYYTVVIGLMLMMLFPFLWMLLNSFKTPLGITKLPPEWFFKPTLMNYIEVFKSQNFARYIFNSTVIATGATFFALVLGLPAAFSIARYKQSGFGLVILLARMTPGITFLIPLFILFREMKMVDTYTSLILSHMLVGMPFVIWVMVPFFQAIPRELDEAARVDGCSVFATLWRVILPISGPGIITASILSFLFSWNNFMFSIVLAASRTKTLPVAVYNFISYAEINWGGLMAAAVVITLPVLILALVMQRYIIRGLTAGAVKG